MTDQTPKEQTSSLLAIKEAFFNKKEKALSSEVKELLFSYYGDEINYLEGTLPNGEKYNYTSLLLNFYRLVFDQGLSRRIEFNEERGEPVYLLSRFAWIDQIERKGGENFTNLEAILMLDVVNLFGANRVAEANGDLLLNKVGRIIIEKVEELRKLFPGYFFIPCRYGGDEFALAIIKNPSFQGESQLIDSRQLLDVIKKSLSHQSHQYASEEGKKLITQPIELKEEGTGTIVIPTDELKRKIFLWALDRGLVMKEGDINLFINNFGNNQEMIEKYLKENQRFSSNQLDNLSLMKDLVAKHPELTGPLFLANALDQNALDQKEEGIDRRLASLLKLIDRALFDRLLGDWVLSFEDFKNHIKRGEFHGGVLGIEMKLIKEINDYFSMAVSDQIIKALYEEIIAKIPQEERKKIQIFRRGGSFFIGLRQSLREEVLSALTNLSSITINEIFGHRLIQPLVIPLASFYDSKLQLDGLRNFMNLLNKEWYKNVIRANLSFIEKVKTGEIQKPVIKITGDNLFNYLTIENLLSLFFTSEKRGQQRREEFTEINTSEV